MAKGKKSKKPPSKKRYDEEHRVRSARLDKEYNERLDKLLEGLGLSYSEYVKAHIREDEAMIEKKAEMLVSRQVDPSVEERIRELEDLVCQILITPQVTNEFPPFCPHCDGQLLLRCEADEVYSRYRGVLTWKCPKCGFFVNTYKRIDPKSIKWSDADSGVHINKPKPSAKHSGKKHK